MILDFTYNYGKGHMTVDIDHVLRNMDTKRFRKLLRVMPGEKLPEIRERTAALIDRSFEDMRDYFNTLNEDNERLPEEQDRLDKMLEYRDRYKRGSRKYKVLTPEVKEQKKRVSNLKQHIRYYNGKLRENTNLKRKLETWLGMM